MHVIYFVVVLPTVRPPESHSSLLSLNIKYLLTAFMSDSAWFQPSAKGQIACCQKHIIVSGQDTMSVVRQQMESKCLCSLINECQPIVKQPVSHNKTSKLYQCIAYIPGYSEKRKKKKNCNFLYFKYFSTFCHSKSLAIYFIQIKQAIGNGSVFFNSSSFP